MVVRVHRKGARVRAYGLALLAAMGVGASTATVRADPAGEGPAVSAQDKREAAKKFAEGKRAFFMGDFPRAAEAFEEANRLAPHHSSLWNAARAWHRAGNLTRAANQYAAYLEIAPPRAPDRNRAMSAVTELTPQLGKLEVHAAEGFEEVRLDGQPVEDKPVFVTPGDHLIEGRFEGKLVREKKTIEAGSMMSVTLEPPPPPPPPPKPKPKPKPKPAEGWSPTVAYAGGAVTVVAAAFTTWSGLNTWSQKDAFDTAPTQDNLDEGKSRQTRTNIGLGVRVAAAAFTTVATVWMVDWKEPDEPAAGSLEVSAGLGSVSVGGRF
jgi:hypothetical protein